MGDAGFTLHLKLLVPFSGKLTPDQHEFKHLISKTRIRVEHMFGLWKARFRCLLHEVYAEPELASNLIMAMAVLHNICQLHDDRVWESWKIIIPPHEVPEAPEAQVIAGRTAQWRNDLMAEVLFNYRNEYH